MEHGSHLLRVAGRISAFLRRRSEEVVQEDKGREVGHLSANNILTNVLCVTSLPVCNRGFGRFHFHEDYWCNTSTEAMDLIRKMLTVDQRKRWTAAQLLT